MSIWPTHFSIFFIITSEYFSETNDTLKFDKKIIQKPKQTLLSKRKIVYYSRNLSNDKNTSIFIFNRVEVDIVAIEMNLGF